jgi:hypothetical protein
VLASFQNEYLGQTESRMGSETQAHDVLAATLIAIVSIFAFVLGVSGLKRRARKFARNTRKAQ